MTISSPDGTGVSDRIVLRRLGALLSLLVPGTAVSGLLLYFGREYTHALYGALGVSGPGMEFSTADYVVRSLAVIVKPARTVALILAALVVAHFLISLAVDRWGVKSPRGGWVVGAVLIVLGVGGVVLFWTPRTARSQLPVTLEPSSWASTALWLLSIIVAFYGVWLGWLRTPPQRSRLWRRFPVASVLLGIVAILMVAFGAFETTRAYAVARAKEGALANETNCTAFRMVDVVASVDLALAGPGVNQVVTEGLDEGFRYRWTGFRHFTNDNGRFLIWPVGASPRDGLTILNEDDGIRFEPSTDTTAPASCPILSPPGQ